MPNIIIVLHTKSNTGYAIAPLETTFYKMAYALTQNAERIHFAYKNLNDGKPTSLPDGFENVIAIDNDDATTFGPALHYIKQRNVQYAFCFDLPVRSALVTLLRDAGIQRIISYWGATMSSENTGVKLLAKKMEVFLSRSKPNHFIFESEAMRHLAVQGRGVARRATSVIPTGIDTDKYHPNHADPNRLNQLFAIPAGAKVIFYSGHMEPRKGVHVIIDAALALTDEFQREDIYFLITGNKPGEELPFLQQLGNHSAKSRVIFAGYRTDLHLIMPCCTLGTIASTGWDSFPMSSIEMASCGLPLVVSSLQGLNETIEDGITGLKFPPGDHRTMAKHIVELINSPERCAAFSQAARLRAVSGFSNEHQLTRLISCCTEFFK